jgi:CDP-paratose 2-epimerase
MEGMRILITGGAGFVGSNLADALVRSGNDVTIFDNLFRRGSELNLSWLRDTHGDSFRFVEGDVRDKDAIARAAEGAQAIYHIAGQTAVTTSVLNPREDFEINALGTFNTLEAARLHADNPVFVMTSTNKVYGGMEDVVVEEGPTRYYFRDFPQGISEARGLDFHSPYGCSKGTADQYVHDYARIYGLKSVVFRMSCIYGPHQWGMEDQAWVAWFVIQALKNRPITIYGDGKQVRDVLFIDDLVDAFIAVADNIERCSGEVFNIGGGADNALSIWCDLRPLLSEALGENVREAGFADWRPGDQKIYVSNTAKAAADFGWEPKVGIAEGLQRLVDWARQNRDNF